MENANTSETEQLPVYDRLSLLVHDFLSVKNDLDNLPELPSSPYKPIVWESAQQKAVYDAELQRLVDLTQSISAQRAPYWRKQNKVWSDIETLLKQNPDESFLFNYNGQKHVGWSTSYKNGYITGTNAHFETWENYCTRYNINPKTGRSLEQEAEERIAQECEAEKATPAAPKVHRDVENAVNVIELAKQVAAGYDIEPNSSTIIQIAQLIAIQQHGNMVAKSNYDSSNY